MPFPTELCPVCHRRTIDYICTAGTDAGTTVGELRCADCAASSAASWELLPIAADAFIAELRQYAETALWTTNSDDLDPEGTGHAGNLDDRFDAEDLAPEAIDSMAADLASFMTWETVQPALEYWREQLGEGQIGHDFWLTRNGHGAGFWDRFSGGHEGEAHGRMLTDQAKTYGSSDLYVGDDGRVYVS